eukprot:3828022-Amphidinium_carterae.1
MANSGTMTRLRSPRGCRDDLAARASVMWFISMTSSYSKRSKAKSLRTDEINSNENRTEKIVDATPKPWG